MTKKTLFINLISILFSILLVFGGVLNNKNDYIVYAEVSSHIEGNLKKYDSYDYSVINSRWEPGISSAITANPVFDMSCGPEDGLDIAIGLDASTSLNHDQLEIEKQAIINFIEAFRDTKTRFTVTRFSGHAGHILENPTSDTDAIINAVRNYTGRGDGTNWLDAFEKGIGMKIYDTYPGSGWHDCDHDGSELEVIGYEYESGSPIYDHDDDDYCIGQYACYCSKGKTNPQGIINSNNRKLFVLFTDGSPNKPGNTGHQGSQGSAYAVLGARYLKSLGIRILGVLIDTTEGRSHGGVQKLQYITGLNELLPIGVGSTYSESDILNADYMHPTFDSVSNDIIKYVRSLCPSNLPYKEVIIQGSLKQDDQSSNTSCSQSFTNPAGIANTRPIISFFGGGAGTSASCDIIRPGDTTYRCRLSIDSQVNRSINPIQTIRLSNSWYPGSETYWLGSCTETTCQPSTDCDKHTNRFVVNFSQDNPVTYQLDMVFPIRENWFKLKNTSFNSVGTATRNNVIPQIVSQYDTIDDITDPNLIVGEGGLVTTKANFNVGGRDKYSNNNWLLQGYTTKKKFNEVSEYINYYIKPKTDYRTITAVSQIDPNDGKKIYYYNGNLTIDTTKLSQIDRENLSLIVDGEVDFALGTGATFAPTKSIAIIAKSIMFYNKNSTSQVLSSAKGIFIADTIILGDSIDIPMKIKGNLVTLTDRVENSRKQTDMTKPSLFVVFDPTIYLDTLFTVGIRIFNSN